MNLEVIFTMNKYICFLAADLKHEKDYIKYVHMFIYLLNKVNVNTLILEISSLGIFYVTSP